MGLSVVIVGKVTNDAGRWVKLAEESLAQYCDKPTAVGYALCYSDAAKKTFLEDEEVCMYLYVYMRVYPMCVHVCIYSTCIPALPTYMHVFVLIYVVITYSIM